MIIFVFMKKQAITILTQHRSNRVNYILLYVNGENHLCFDNRRNTSRPDQITIVTSNKTLVSNNEVQMKFLKQDIEDGSLKSNIIECYIVDNTHDADLYSYCTIEHHDLINLSL